MHEYIIGKINYINSSYLILENNFIGYKINVSDTTKFELNKFQKLYIYVKIYQNIKNNFSFEYYGFKTINEKIFFEILLGVNGVGVKIAQTILKNDIQLVKNLIRDQDIESLSSLEGFTNKIATNIVSQLSYKLKIEKMSELSNSEIKTNNKLNEVVGALKSLGYKKHEIEKVMINLDNEIFNNFDELSDAISYILKLMIEEKNGTN